MANQLPLLENLTPEDVQQLIDACVNFDAKNILGPEYEEVLSYSIPHLNLSWKNKKDFEKDIKFITKTNTIIEANKKLEKKLVEISKNVDKENPANTPDKWTREEQESDREIRERQIKETKIQAEKQVRESIGKKQQLYEKQQIKNTTYKIASAKIQDKVISELKGKVIYAVPDQEIPQIALTANEKVIIEIAQNNPSLFAKNLSALIIENNPDISRSLADIIAADAANVLSSNVDNKPIPTGVFASLVQAPDKIQNLSDITKDELAKTSAITTASWESWNNFKRDILIRSVGPNLTNMVLEPPEFTYHISDTQEAGSYMINIGLLQEKSFDIQKGEFFETLNSAPVASARQLASKNLNQYALLKLQTLPKGTVSRLMTSDTFQVIAPLVGFMPINTYVGSNFFGKTVTLLFPKYAPLIEAVAWKMGIGMNVGIVAIPPNMMDAAIIDGLVTPSWMLNKAGLQTAGQVAKGATTNLNTILGNAVAKGASSILSKIGMQGAAAKVGAMAGSGIIPVIGTIVGAIIGSLLGKIVEKIPWKKIAPWLLGGLVGAGTFVLIGPIAGVVSGVAVFGITSAATVGSITLGVVGSKITKLFVSIGSVFFTTFLRPLLITAMGLVILTAFILFIINSGAYVVPNRETLETPFTIASCTNEKGSISFSNTATSKIANRAWEIVGDLYQGFWCFWNRSPKAPPPYNTNFPNDTILYPPSYPGLFNYSLYEKSPSPTVNEVQTCGDCMYWCTQLVQNAYRESGNTDLLVTLWSPAMQDDFIKRNKFVYSKDASYENTVFQKKVVPGSVIFFHVLSGQDRTNHVGIVYSVSIDGVSYVQANAPTKDGFVPFDIDGYKLQNLPGIEVVGIGLP